MDPPVVSPEVYAKDEAEWVAIKTRNNVLGGTGMSSTPVPGVHRTRPQIKDRKVVDLAKFLK